MKLIHVLGLGESLEDFKQDGNTTIGVNDIHSKIKTDYVVCVDKPSVFDPKRLLAIQQTKCKTFYSQLADWSTVENFTQITFANGRGVVDELGSEKFCYSISSPYVAVVLAYVIGATDIVMHGVDFKTHKNFQGASFDKAINDFKKLNDALKLRGVNLWIGSDYSALSEFLGVFTFPTKP